MNKYSGFQYLLIDLANAFGLDKLLFEQRIDWAMQNLNDLESIADKADSYPLYMKAMMAVRKAQRHLPTGHLVGFDAACSGMQVMSVLTGCISGATATGLVDPNVRADAYTTVTDTMRDILGGLVPVARKDAKQAVMTVLYGSKAEPKKLFGKDTPELNAFYQAMHTVAPGAWELLQDLLASWQPYALVHEWKLPDGFDARVKVMKKVEARIEVDELNHSTFSYEFYENEGQEKGLSNVANAVHSVDAYVLRSMHRRCNYDVSIIQSAYNNVVDEITARTMEVCRKGETMHEKVAYYIQQYERSTVADVVIAPWLDRDSTRFLSDDHLIALCKIMDTMLQHKPFELVTIHDEFKAHANNINHVRQHYIDIMAELAESNLIDDLLTQITKTTFKFTKLSNNLGELIRGSNYALS